MQKVHARALGARALYTESALRKSFHLIWRASILIYAPISSLLKVHLITWPNRLTVLRIASFSLQVLAGNCQLYLYLLVRMRNLCSVLGTYSLQLLLIKLLRRSNPSLVVNWVNVI